MTRYQYRAARADGAIVTGEVETPSAPQASALITDRGLFPISVNEEEGRATGRRPASRRDLAIVFQSLAALVSAGVPLERAVASTETLARGVLRQALVESRARLHEGAGFAQALAATGGIVPELVVEILRAGERGSQLSRALDEVASHLEQEAELVARVRQALAYPLLLAVVGVISVLVIGTVIVPRFAEVLGDLGQELPPATRLLLFGSGVLAHHWFLLVPVLVAACALGREVLRRPASGARIEEALLSAPLVGPVRLALATSRICRALGGMLAAGMPLLAALDAAQGAAGDRAVGARLGHARERVAAGEPVALSLEREAALAPSAVQLIHVGESSGRLGEMTRRAGDLAAEQAERGLKTLVTLLEPALIIAFGGLVAFVAAALLQAVYAVRPGG